MSVEDIDIDNCCEDGRTIAELINSPRSVEAFKRCGVLPFELEPIGLEEIERRALTRNNGKPLSVHQLNLRVECAKR